MVHFVVHTNSCNTKYFKFFPVLWRKWIKECVSTATASVLVNGSPTDEFPLKRGLRQGDPLSPFLFLLAAEGLNIVMKSLVEAQLFSGYSIGAANPIVVSHLQFADDTLLLGSKSWANVRALRAALVLFEAMSGLKVNFHKSMLVGVNIGSSWLYEAASVLSCKVGIVPFLYLDMPIGGNPRRLCFWEPIVNRIKSRLSGWNSRFLSFGGRLVLLKSVLTSLPVYALSFFKAPTGEAPLCMRFRRLFELTENKSMSVADLLSVDSERWGEVWRWRRSLWQWEEELLDECRALLLDVSLNPIVSDSWVWLPDPSGGYTVRGAYSLLISQVPPVAVDDLDLVWHKQVPLKVSVFAWRLLRDRLPTRTNLIARRVLSSDMSSCVAGCGHPESARHLFLLCDTFGSLWHLVRDWIGCFGVDTDNISAHFLQFTHLIGGGAARSFMQLIWLLCAWVVWNERNNRMFNHVVTPIPCLLDKIKLLSLGWLKAKKATFVFGTQQWWSSPLVCLGIG
ncbi:uncharacterized protein [Medicago truncatula]|uniref:uncharacterized protein n=1 Tax=Medicago truncatula TaxID=3880 RepID=UPI001967E09F|nr:uncharacterized protein LOC112420986 [Medicago truncatula]